MTRLTVIALVFTFLSWVYNMNDFLVKFLPGILSRDQHLIRVCHNSWMCSISYYCFNKLINTIHFQVSLPFLFMICFLRLAWALEHNLFSLSLATPFGFVCFWVGLGSSLFVLPCPLLLGWFHHNQLILSFHFNRLIFSLYPQIILVMNTTGRNSVFLFIFWG